MSCSGLQIQARRNADLRITYAPNSRKFSFANMSPLLTVRLGDVVKLSVSSTATVNGSVFSVVGDAVVLTIAKEDIALLDSATPDTEKELLNYDVVFTDQTGFENWILGGQFVVLGINDTGDCGCSGGDVEISLGGECVEISIDGGNVGVGSSVSLAELNQAVQDAEQSASDAENAAQEAQDALNSISAGLNSKANVAADNISPATWISALGLGNSATMDIGTSSGTVAAGDDARIVGALQSSLNLSDVSNVDRARDNLRIADFPTKAAAESSLPSLAQAYIAIAGYYSPGDLGGGLYARASSEPASGGKLQTADGSWWRLSERSVTLEMYGAKGDGASDDTAAIVAAISDPMATEIVLQDKNYCHTGFTVTRPFRVRGINRWFSKLICTSATARAIVVGAAPVEMDNFTVDRSVAAVSGADGIDTLNGGFGVFRDLVIQNHYDGIVLKSTANSEFSNSIVQFNYRHGVTGVVSSTGAEPALQWKMTNIISQMNDGKGFAFYASAHSGGPLQTGFMAVNCGTFRNGTGGWEFSGDANTEWNDVNMFHCYSSFCNGHGFAWYNCGANNQMFDTFCEWNGMVPGGREFDNIPAAGAGNGIFFTGGVKNDTAMILSGVTVQNSANSAIAVSGGSNLRTLQVIGAKLHDNGQGGDPYQSDGLHSESEVTEIIVSNMFSGGQVHSTQQYGVAVSSNTVASKIYIWGAVIRGNAAGASNVSSANFGAWQVAT